MFGHDENNDHDENNKPDDQNHDNKPTEEVFEPSDAPKDDNWQHPGPPPTDDDSDDSDNKPDESDEPRPATTFSLGHSDSEDDSNAPGNGNDLIDLKQEALGKLSPLVGHLDQTPDEKFRTLMMMIQASDDQALVRQAYDTALKIDDEKERAQALLDIVNEINYFTQNPGNDTD